MIISNSNKYNHIKNQKQYNPPKSVSFGTTEVFLEGSKQACCYFNKSDTNWHQFAYYLGENYPNGIKIIENACSDGSEAYAKVIPLIHVLGFEKARKFLPIEAKDISSTMLKKVHSGIIGIKDSEMDHLWWNYSSYSKREQRFAVRNLFKKTDLPSEKLEDNNVKAHQYSISPPLKRCVNFQYGDVVEQSAKKYDKPVLFSIRNVLHHLPNEEKNTKKLLKNLSKLPQNSLIMVGQIERRSFSFYNYLTEHFEPVEGFKYSGCSGGYTLFKVPPKKEGFWDKLINLPASFLK